MLRVMGPVRRSLGYAGPFGQFQPGSPDETLPPLAAAAALPKARRRIEIEEQVMIRTVMAAVVLIALTGGASAQGAGEALTREDVQALREAAQATAKATRENVDYARVVPDVLHQILAKLDKIENKLDKLENLQRASAPRQRPAR
jgi:hypothetical protein